MVVLGGHSVCLLLGMLSAWWVNHPNVYYLHADVVRLTVHLHEHVHR